MTAPSVDKSTLQAQKLAKGEDRGPSSSTNVRVVGRIRPMAEYEKEKGSKQVVSALSSASTHATGRSIEPEVLQIHQAGAENRWFELDAVFDENSTQADVYVRCGAQQAICEDVFKGFNCTILAYGQTGAGKTFTMGTAAAENRDCSITEMDGVIPRACNDLFNTIAEKCDGNAQVELSYMEVYNEEIRDLLSKNPQDNSALRIRETLDGQVYVRGLVTRPVGNSAEVGQFMEEASKRRVVASTKMNATSSRSHAICVLGIKGIVEDGTKFQAKMTLVDLAGSERIKKTGAAGNRAQEGININKGLFVLGQVVSALAEQRPKFKRKPPYRDSKLTRLLQDSLGGNSRTIMVACVSPADLNVDESINTLRYATSARNIKNTATRNVILSISPEEAAKLQRENTLLKAQVTELQETIEKMAEEMSPPMESDDDDDISLTIEHLSQPDIGDHQAERIIMLEREVKSLKTALRAAGGIHEQLTESAIELPAMKVQVALLEDELHASQSINEEVDDLHRELEEAKAEAHAAKLAAHRLSQIIESNNESKGDDVLEIQIPTLQAPAPHSLHADIAWVLFVSQVINTFKEHMRQLGDYFEIVTKVVESPDIGKMIPRKTDPGPKKRWWAGGASGTEVESMKAEIDLRQKLMSEHVHFYQDRFLEIEDMVTSRVDAVDVVLERMKAGTDPGDFQPIEQLSAILIPSSAS